MASAWAQKPSSSSSPIPPQRRYDVFLSFSGIDTRNNFTSHLLAALERHGFHTFRDNTKLNRGEDIGYELLKAIEDSRISLVVLSRNYAASGWCLDELVKIMECWKTLQHIVFPIFHGVGPTDVRAQKGSLAEAFDKHAERFKDQSPGSKVEKWKEALTQIANLSGWDLPKLDNGSESRYISMSRDEAKLIQKIVEEVGNRLDIGHLNVANHQVGMESRLQELNVLLRMESSNVRIIGIWGIGGIGKTTIAMKQFNVIRHMFEGSSFLANVAETSKQPNGLVCLQEQLLLDLCSNGTHNIRNSYEGIEVIKRRAFCRKVLLVLDDVDNVQQLKALAIDQDSFRFGPFGTGSRIIITTRDVSLLNLLKVDEIYAAKELNRSESVQLLSWHAFKEDHPKGNYLDLSDQVMAYAGGLPLALEVLGSFLYGKSIHEWKSAISKLKKIPLVDVQAKLKISFDSLSDEVKELFLDMACFFAGTYGVSTIKILEGCNFFAAIGIRVLADRCLIKYGPCNELLMHDLIRGMGREIVRQESVKEPGKRSRLWYKEDALEVLRDGTGTEAVEGLFLNFAEPNDIQVNPRAFEKMNRLWLLHLNYVNLSVGYEHISKRLLWLCWNGFPLKCVPSKLYMENLVTLDLSHSRLKQVWKGTKILVKLKFLYLSHCYYLTRTPDFSGLDNLEELLLNDCIRLVEVDDSIRFLKKLVVLNMKNCKKLRKLPSSIWMLKTLENLDLSGSSMLGKFYGIKLSKSLSPFLSSWIFRTKRVDSIGLSLSPLLGLSCLKELRMENCNLSCLPNEVGNLISLETLDLGKNNLRTLPDNICNLTRLKKLYLSDCDVSHLPSEIGRLIALEALILEGNSLLTFPDSICNLTRLKNLNLSDCDLSHLPSEIGQLISLQKLNLRGNNLLTLPDSICNLACLEVLLLPHCNVSHLPDGIGMLSSLKWFDLKSNNVSILPNSFSDLASLEILSLSNCGRLQSLPKLPASLYHVDASNCTLLLERIPTEFNWLPGSCMPLWERSIQRINVVHLPGDEVPNWFPYQYTGSKLSLVVPPLVTRRIVGWNLCIVFRTHKKPGQGSCMYIFSKKTEGLRNENKYKTGVTYQDEDRIKLIYFPSVVTGIHLFGGDELEIEISLDDHGQEKTVPWLTLKKCGIQLVYEDNVDITGISNLYFSFSDNGDDDDDRALDLLSKLSTAWANKASSSSFSISAQFKYDVFLSFSGVDTRNNFTSHLLAALERHGFHSFRDDTKLNRGEYIGYELLKAIEESRISLVILSKNYASSRWCLDELVKIMECRKTLQQIVLPIFYNVEPSDVRAQKGSLAEAFAKHEERLKEGSGGRVEKWREALTEVANLSGWDLPKVANGDEAHLIQKVVEEVQNNLNIVLLHVACHEIGLESRLQKLKLLLKMETDDVRIVAIWGMGGIGKTTIAKKLYNLIRHKFEGSTFLANIRETSKQADGLVVLQEQLLSDILRSGTHNLRNFHQGIEVIKRRAFCRKVLLILDDVDDVQQLKALAIDRDSFGFGSRIIVTTRDISSLNLLKVDEIYAVEKLNEDESLELFSWLCFKEDHPTEDHLDLSNQVVDYAGGLPLALEVLGSFFCGKSIPQWKSAIEKLRKIPDDDVQGKLKISFDSLSKELKELFLDVACFFVGTGRNFTVKVLESCNCFAEIGIRVLADRCLIKYHPTLILMHDLLGDMGREIVRQESVKDPGRRSRLWYHEDALGVLGDGTGTEAVEGLFLNFHELNVVQVNSKAFEKMNRLWLLHLNYVHLREGYEHISRRLMWLCWNGFPLKCLPSTLHMENLVTLDLCYSSLKKAWNGTKILVKLKFLYLSNCYHLIETPDFSGLNNLEELLLNDCIRLEEADESIRFLDKLLVLDMRNCKKLRKIPSNIWMLKSLESLDFSGCSMLGKFSGLKGSPSKSQSSFLLSWNFRTKRVDSIGLSLSPVLGLSWLKDLRMENCNLSCLPNEVGNLISLETLDLSGNNFPTLPDSICDLTRLKNLNLSDCDVSHLPGEIGRLISLKRLYLGGNNLLTLPDSFCDLACLSDLDLNGCNLSHLPNRIGMLSSLMYLYLERNNVCSLPNSFSDLASLEKLSLRDCGRLQSLPELPASLEMLLLWNCGRLQSLPELPVSLRSMDASYCALLESIPTELDWQAGLTMSLLGCNTLAKNNFANKEWSAASAFDRIITITFLGDEVPSWFQYQYTGSKFSLVVPPLVTRRILGCSFCVVFRTHENRGCQDYLMSIIRNTEFIFSTFNAHQDQDQMILVYVPSDCGQIHGGDELEIQISQVPWLTVKKCGINLIYEDDEDNTEMPIKKTQEKLQGQIDLV
ncbi:hypothetical protein RHGRI_035687 [Rhododendron griersonianum]|uniref:ADP-ribosyl cyclase/cyclic ADP-ribose hydrolase n=1 Tax=Rhododendron griersonianum TaxID=479676 RepID=A0AAV6HQE7_9ERIC|nr:hypothetical protein RHGRI_035687 [Rhododendron griersonianum]